MKRFLVGLMVAAMATIGFASVASASTSAWTEYVYNPSGNALKPLTTTTSANGTVVSFNFAPGVYTALLTTSDSSLTGNLSSMSLNDAVSVTNMNVGAYFQDQNNGGCTPDNQSVRLYFMSPQAAGTTGFFTQFWWSNPVSLTLTNDVSGTLSVSFGDPTQWSDWNGQKGDSSVDVTAAFVRATQHVQTVGLSFGGGCFFENGVATSDGSGTFNSTFSEN